MKFWAVHVAPEDEALKDKIVAYLRRQGLHVDVEECDSDQLDTSPQYKY